MNKIKRTIMQTILVLMFCSFCLINASSLEFANITVIDEIDIPENLEFSVSKVCSRYDYFMQATAREDGCFAIYARHVDMDQRNGTDFEKVYIDLYDADGKFVEELSFTTPFDLAVELTQETVNIYFYKSVLVYNLETQELRNYSIPDGSATNIGLYERLRENEFVSGEWLYSCKKTYGNFTELSRSNGNQYQILLQTSGTEFSFGKAFFGGLVIAVTGAMFVKWLKKHREKNRETFSALTENK